MNTFAPVTRACVLILTGVLFAGCGAGGALQSSYGMSQSQTIAGASASRCAAEWIANARTVPCRPNKAKSWMKAAKGTELLYVSDIVAEDVDVFSYPDGKQVGTLTGFNEPNGLCADKKGDVFVSDTFNDRVVEYAHGGTQPIATLSTGKGTPLGCAIDPKTGDLATSNYARLQNGSISIFKKARGTPTTYTGLFVTFFCTYDGSGNLFIDGFAGAGVPELGEVAVGSTKMAIVNQTAKIGWPGGISWDGQYLVVGDQYASKFVPSRPPNALYQLTITNGTANLSNMITLGGAEEVVQFWLDGATVIGPDAIAENVPYYAYPAGGNPTNILQADAFYEPVGAALSK
jgi:hypothetical protein